MLHESCAIRSTSSLPKIDIMLPRVNSLLIACGDAMLDFSTKAPHSYGASKGTFSPDAAFNKSGSYKVFKRLFDLTCSVALVPLLLLFGFSLLILNPFFNAGSLFYVQERMGKDCRSFRAFKFRSMMASGGMERGAFDRLEHHRITRLGRLLRKCRIDELPQIINVLRGEMSLIGPRPDALEHAKVYVLKIPGYRERCAALPGISGYAQTEVGYVDGIEGVHNKVAADLYYLSKASVAFDLWIAWRTLQVVLLHRGA